MNQNMKKKIQSAKPGIYFIIRDLNFSNSLQLPEQNK
jgi:hypothetical protein